MCPPGGVKAGSKVLKNGALENKTLPMKAPRLREVRNEFEANCSRSNSHGDGHARGAPTSNSSNYKLAANPCAASARVQAAAAAAPPALDWLGDLSGRRS